MGGVDLQLEGGELGGFLLIAIELLKAGLEAVGEEERHQVNLINDLSGYAGKRQSMPQATQLFV